MPPRSCRRRMLRARRASSVPRSPMLPRPGRATIRTVPPTRRSRPSTPAPPSSSTAAARPITPSTSATTSTIGSNVIIGSQTPGLAAARGHRSPPTSIRSTSIRSPTCRRRWRSRSKLAARRAAHAVRVRPGVSRRARRSARWMAATASTTSARPSRSVRPGRRAEEHRGRSPVHDPRRGRARAQVTATIRESDSCDAHAGPRAALSLCGRVEAGVGGGGARATSWRGSAGCSTRSGSSTPISTATAKA